MAFSSAPSNDTYSSERIPLVADLDQNPYQLYIGTVAVGATYGFTGMTNVVPFKNVNKEHGTEMIGETRNSIAGGWITSATTTCRGMYVWQKDPTTLYFFMVTTDGTTSKVWAQVGFIWTVLNTLPTNASTPVRFTEFINDTNTKSLIMVDGVDGYIYTSAAAGTRIVDADFPTPHVPFPIFMDGYLFLAKKGTGDIYNSDLNVPTSWTAGSFISSELYPDDIQALVKINNYILAVGTQGCEYFYDAAVATASPLARQEGASLPFGTLWPNTIAATKDTVLFIANNNDGSNVLKIIENFKHAEFPAETTLRLLSNYLAGANTTADIIRGYFIRQNGELLYALNFNGADTTAAPGIQGIPTLAASISTKTWCRLATGNDASYNFPVSFTAPASIGTMMTYIAGQYDGKAFFGTLSPTVIYDSFQASSGVSASAIFLPVMNQLDTPATTFGTMNRKNISRLGVLMSRLDGNGNPGPGTTNPWISWSDDNGQTYTTPVQLSGTVSSDFPFLTQLGTTRSRRFRIQANISINNIALKSRWYAIEVDINKGQQ